MSLSKAGSNTDPKSGSKKDDVNPLTSKGPNNLVVRIDQDSSDNLQELFDSVLNPGDSKRPLQVPFRMRKLPNSFFNPPTASSKSPSASHSRANSADSAFDAGSQPSINQANAAVPSREETAIAQTAVSRPPKAPSGLIISHSRAHSSPASLHYNVHAGGENAACGPDGTGSVFPNFPSGTNPASNTSIERSNQFIGHGNTAVVPAFHMKQRSYDVVSPIQLQNELGSLPPGWEQAKTNDGQIYYLNHITKTTQWEDPRIQYKQQQTLQQALNQAANLRDDHPKETLTLPDSLGPLPEGWEQAFTESGDVYFINHVNRTTSWNDPRIPDFLHKSAKVQKSQINWLATRQHEKESDYFKLKPEQNPLVRPSANLQMDPFLSGDNHARQESSDSGLSLSSNTFSVNTEFIPPIDDSMDGITENGNINPLNGLDCPDNLVSSLQLEDDISEMFNDVHNILNPSTKPENLEWYKIN